MRKFIIPAFAAAAILGSHQASAFTHDVQLNATVGEICSFTPPVTSGSGYITNVSSTGSTLDVEIDAQGIAVAVSDTLTFADAICNAATTVRLERGLLRHTVHAGGVPGFVTTIPYSAEVNWSGLSVASISGFSTSDEEDIAPRSGDITLRIDVQESEGTLAAGSYHDTLRLTVTPQ